MCECYKGANELRYCNNHGEISGGSLGNLEKISGGSYSSVENSYSRIGGEY